MVAEARTGRTAVVTGGGRGIGLAIGRRFARNGDSVVLIDLDPGVTEAGKAMAEETGVAVKGVTCDVTDGSAVKEAFAAIADEFGSVDVLINNAGVLRDNLIHKMSEDDWDTVMGVHLKGAYLCAKAAQTYMVPKRYGKIVNLSSTSSLGNRGQLNYSTAKAGLQGFTRTLALDLGKFSINVNCIAPGFIDTEMTRSTAERQGIDPEDYKKMKAEKIAIGRVGVPEDVANVANFLASDEASFVNGQIIYVSGGPETRR
ncbi:MAG: 3-oxoacyl-ACP reductase FabG [Roseovarius sp.]|uniref:SDR family NAD(P)-dependent oxidoreductase n=1 Tax=Roseovarius sp. TaxID=1486281 RepID=UPI0032ED7032